MTLTKHEPSLEKILPLIRALLPTSAARVATRAAMRVLPLLGQSGKRRDEETIAFFFQAFRSCQSGAIISLTSLTSLTSATPAAYVAYAAYARAATPPADDAADDAAAAIDAAAYTAYAAIENRFAGAFAADAATFAVDAADAHGAGLLCSSLEEDLDTLKAGIDLAPLPLWTDTSFLPEPFATRWLDLQALMLELDPGFKYWIDWYEARLRGEPLIWEEICEQILLTEETLSLPPAQINAYLLKLASKEAILPLNRARVILIGPGDAGKTSLLRVLHGEPVQEGEEKKTVGIEIRESAHDSTTQQYRVDSGEEQETVIHFWDFGGQVMYHATHQFFLRSHCVYILVLDGRRTGDGSHEAEYWLEHIRAFAPKAPVLLVGNKADQGAMDWDRARLKRKYLSLHFIGFYQLSCIHLDRCRHDFEKFKMDLQATLAEVGTVQQKFTPEEFAVLGALRRHSSQETFFRKDRYEALCSEQGVTGQNDLLTLFDKLGLVIHFPDLPRLDAYLLNPRWLTYGVYQLIDRGEARVSEKSAIQHLSASTMTDNQGKPLQYPSERCGFLLDAMVQFKMAYPLENKEYVIPNLLSSDEPQLTFPEEGARAFRFRFEGLLPPQLLPQLIVQHYGEIHDNTVWRQGVLLHTSISGGATALLRADAYDRTLTLWVAGTGLQEYFAVLYYDAKSILASMPELPYEEEVRLPVSARVEQELGLNPGVEGGWGSWANALAAGRMGWETILEKGVKYHVDRVLGIMSKDERRKREWEIVVNQYNGCNIGTTRGNNQGSVGNHSTTINQELAGKDLPQLAEELAVLLDARKTLASEPTHFQDLTAISQAKEAARQGDGQQTLTHLKSIGAWGLHKLEDLGVNLLASVIAKASGLA